MSKNTELAAAILEQVGGRENITHLYHCMTRLRFSLKDFGAIDENKIKNIKGVMGVQNAEGELQVIIGPAVAEVCDEISSIAGIAQGEAGNENPDAEKKEKEKLTLKSAGSIVMGAVSACMSPLVPLFIVVGLANVIAAIIGPSMLGIVSDTAPIYTNFYWMGQAILYFLPVLTAITASKYFKTNPMIAVSLACIMLYPDLLAALAAEGGYTVYGITAPNVAYNGQIIPIILVVWTQSYVEKLLNKIVPNIVKVLLVPFGIVAIMMPLMLCLLGPVGDYIGSGIATAVLALYQFAGPVETALIGAVTPFLTAFGIGRPLFFACMTVLTSTGTEYSYMPYAMVLTNFTVMGCVLGYIIKTKSADNKQVGITSFVANCLGGVSEPALFGIVLPNPKTFIPVLAGGAVSGLYMGITKVGYYQFGPSNILSVLGFISPESSSNLVNGIIGAALGLVITLILMLVLYKESDPGEICAPITGNYIPLENIPDETFASGTLGQGCGIEPEQGRLYAPADGTISLVADTKHAIGMEDINGAEYMIHVGMDTVSLKGKYFTPKVKAGDKVKAGQILLEFDMDAIKAEGYTTTTAFIIMNHDDFPQLKMDIERKHNAKAPMGKVK